MSLIKSKKTTHKLITYDRGVRGELYARIFLILKGYKILETRFKTPVGEIDLIARQKNTVVFVEVKARYNHAKALESITPKMRGRIERAASYYMARHRKVSDCDMRFDLIALRPFSIKSPFFITHLDNAWRPTA